MVQRQLVYTKQAQRDAKKLAPSVLQSKAESILPMLTANPCKIPPPFEKLVGAPEETYSRRINIPYRLVHKHIPAGSFPI